MSADKQQITQAEAQTPVEALRRVTADEIKKLKAANIITLGDLWFRTGADSLELAGFDKVAEVSKVPSDRLIELLPTRLIDLLRTELLRRASELDLNVSIPAGEFKRDSVWKRPLPAVKKFGFWFRQRMFDWILLLALLGIGFLTLRASGVLANYPPPLGLNESVVVTKRDLKMGDVLQLDRDLSSARLPLKSNYFKTTNGLEGLILRQDVSAQKPLRIENLLRLQVVATKDIPVGERIAKEAVTLAWTPYQPKALLRPEDVVARQARIPIRRENVVLAECLSP